MSRKTPWKSDKYIKISVWCCAPPQAQRGRTHAHYMQKISVLSVYHRKSFEDFFARRLNENDKAKAVTLATFFSLKIRQTKVAFLLLLECSRSASLLLSRTTASPASWLPTAILDSATCRLSGIQQQKRIKQKKMLHLLFPKPTAVQWEPTIGIFPTYGAISVSR